MLHLDTDLLTDGDALALVAASALAAFLMLWHALGLVCGAASRRRPAGRALRALFRVAPARARRTAGVATFAIVFTPAIAQAHPPGAKTAPAADEPFVRAPTVSGAPTAPTAPEHESVVPAAPSPAPTATRTHIVEPGDNLWRIAAGELVRGNDGARPTDAMIVPYWHALIEQNRATLRSGDPSVIFPGEIVTLPAL